MHGLAFMIDPRGRHGDGPRLRRHSWQRRVCSAATVLFMCAAVLPQTVLPQNVSAAPPCDALGKACPLPMNAESARGLALGTGQRASAMSTSALAYNPAGLVSGKLYHIEGVVDYMPDLKTVALGGAVVDSATSRVGAGLGVRGFLGSGGVGGIDARLGLAFPFSDAVSLGVTGRYMNVNNAMPSVDGVARSARLAKGFTMDAALRVAPIPELQLQLGSYNFINLDSAYAPVLVGGGGAFAVGEIAALGADILADITSWKGADFTIGGGAEIFAGRSVPIRAGYSYETKRTQHTLSLGIGYTDNSVGADISLRQQLGGGGDTRIMGAFRFYVH
jgi:opacity protein-like surface antigen